LKKWINVKKYGPTIDPSKFFGAVVHRAPGYLGIEVFFGKCIYEIWTGPKR
jgi:hypothetical protein